MAQKPTVPATTKQHKYNLPLTKSSPTDELEQPPKRKPPPLFMPPKQNPSPIHEETGRKARSKPPADTNHPSTRKRP